MSDSELFRNPLALRSDTTGEEPSGVGALLDRPLTKKTHTDDTLHYIGESLPAATDAETAPVNIANAAGNSIFPARADHQHQFKVPVCVALVYGGTQVIGASSNAFINQWSVVSPTNWLTPGNQVFQLPYTGRYLATMNVACDWISIGMPTHWYLWAVHINDGSSSYVVNLQSFPVLGASTFGGLNGYMWTSTFSQHFFAGGYFQFNHGNWSGGSIYLYGGLTIKYLGPDQ